MKRTIQISMLALLTGFIGVENSLIHADTVDINIVKTNKRLRLKEVASHLGRVPHVKNRQLLDEIANIVAVPAYQTPEIAPAVKDFLNDSDKYTKSRAIYILGTMHDKTSYKRIEKMAQTESDEDVRRMSVWALGKTGGDEAVPTLKIWVSDKNPFIALQAAAALGGLKRKDGYLLAMEKLHDSNPQVRTQAVAALGEIGDPKSEEILRPLLNDPEISQSTVCEAILKIKLATFVTNSEKVAYLNSMLTDPLPEMRVAAAWTFKG